MAAFEQVNALDRLREAIAGINQTYMDALENGDIETVLDLYTDDATIITPRHPLVVGKPNIAEVFREWVEARKETEGEKLLETVEIEGDEHMAYHVGTMITRIPKKRGSGYKQFKTRYVDIFKHQKDGAWKIHVTIISNPNEQQANNSDDLV